MSLNPSLIGCRMPTGFPDEDIFVFDVFVSASLSDRRWRTPVQNAAREINNANGRVKLRVFDFYDRAATPARGDVQHHIDNTALPPEEAHVLVGVLATRAGEGSQKEVTDALQQPTPFPAVFVFYPALQLSPDPNEGTTIHSIRESAKQYSDLLDFVGRLEQSGSIDGERRYCIPFGLDPGLTTERSLQEQVAKQLTNYVRLWIEAAGPATKRTAPPAGASARGNALPRYLGLEPYNRDDADDFFGREREIADFSSVASNLQFQTLHLYGGSGVGKSSLVIAGLLPRLGKSETAPPWNSLHFKPGDDPFLGLARVVDKRRPASSQVGEQGQRRLAERMAQDRALFVKTLEDAIGPKWTAARRVLYIDQLEELLVAGGDQLDRFDRRLSFVEGVRAFLDADPAHFLITTIRTDREELLDDTRWKPLRDLIRRGRLDRIGAPDDDEGLAQIVCGPAERAGFEVAPALVKALRLDIRPVRSWTPLVSVVLQEIIDHWQRLDPSTRTRTMMLQDYEAVGGLRQVITRRADAVMEGLSERERTQLLPRLFPLLVKLDDKGRPVKRGLSLATLDVSSEDAALVDRLVTSRLLVDEGEVELVHDFLFEAWTDLKRWLDEHSADLDELTDLQNQARRWTRSRSDSLLLAPERLDGADKVLTDHPTLSRLYPELARFIQLSKTRRDQAELVRAIAEGNMSDVDRLRRSNVRLTAAQLQSLDTRSAFYYALYPDAVPAGTPSDVRLSSTAFNQAVRRAPDEPRTNATWFTAENITLHVTNSFNVAHFAALGGHVDVLERLAAIAPELLLAPSDKGTPPFHLAAYGGHAHVVDWFANRYQWGPGEVSTPNLQGMTALTWASSKGYADVVKNLLARGATARAATGDSALHYAARSGNAEVLSLLLDAPDADPAQRADGNWSLLQLACSELQADTVRLLMDRLDAAALDVDGRTGAGWTALGIVLGREPTEVSMRLVGDLLNKGADPNLAFAAPSDLRPLHAAVGRGARQAVAILLASPAIDVNSENAARETPLLVATGQRRADIVGDLLQHPRIEIDRADKTGCTPLYRAVLDGALDLVEVLLARNADPTRTFGSRPPIVKTAFMGADDHTRLVRGRIAELLLARGARMPRWHRMRRDEAGRAIGLEKHSPAEIVAELTAQLGAGGDIETFAVAPMVPGAWRRVEPDAAALLLLRANGGPSLSEHLVEELEFSGARFLDLELDCPTRLFEFAVTTPAGDHGTLSIVESQGTLAHLNGKSSAIHGLNRQVGRKLALPVHALQYTRLFTAAMSGDLGNFRCFEHGEQLDPLPAMPDDARMRVGQQAAALRLVETRETDAGQEFMLSARMLYGAELSQTTLRLKENGAIDMPDETILETNLAVHAQVFERGVRLRRPAESPPKAAAG